MSSNIPLVFYRKNFPIFFLSYVKVKKKNTPNINFIDLNLYVN